ncbi:hypothetical protein HPB48_005226 [Haemaphysalis longicornis]|uniref:Ig-like domain-containing protein n=1 Tax=Haemaphysalis longicornis TaxID=44386 RepID=A0A9J6FG48_HAELO|nr:hypothetical protein HPB48_005226 [Haemaphysalis longicornis]
MNFMHVSLLHAVVLFVYQCSFITFPLCIFHCPKLVADKPKVQLTLGSHPRRWNIVEGHDLYLECRVDANPRITDVVWRLDGRDLLPGRHVIMSNQSLVLQRVHRDSSGSYTCVASNRIGETESEPLKITVKRRFSALFCLITRTCVFLMSPFKIYIFAVRRAEWVLLVLKVNQL